MVMTTAEPWAVKLRDQRHIGDFRRWKDHDASQQAFYRVLCDLKRRLSGALHNIRFRGRPALSAPPDR